MVPEVVRAAIRQSVLDGATWPKAAKRFGVSVRTVARVVRDAGGMPAQSDSRSDRVLSLVQREEIRAGLVRGDSFAAIGRRLGKPTSTISREVARNGGRSSYLGWAADRRAHESARRPKVCKLAMEGELREFVIAGLVWPSGGHLSRSRRDSSKNSLTGRRCGCRTRRSTNPCMSRLGASSAKTSALTCAPVAANAKLNVLMGSGVGLSG